MEWVFIGIGLSLGLLFLWGFIAPRGQWRAFAGWGASDEHASEPGRVGYGLRRLISGIGLSAVVVVFVVSRVALIDAPEPEPGPSAIETMWGPTEPSVVDRVFFPKTTSPSDLVAFPILEYQVFDEGAVPQYLAGLDPFPPLESSDSGTPLALDSARFDSAHAVLHLSAPVLCFPHAVVVKQSDTEVRIGVFFGVVGAENASETDNVSACSTDASTAVSILIPVRFDTPLADRTLLALDGSLIARVSLLE